MAVINCFQNEITSKGKHRFCAKNILSEEILLFCTAFPFLARFNAKNLRFGNFG